MTKRLLGVLMAGAALLSANNLIFAEPFTIGQDIIINSEESLNNVVSGSFQIHVDGYHISDGITSYQTNGMDVLCVQCVIENIDAGELLDADSISQYGISEFVKVVDEEGFDCEFYNLEDSQGDEGYAVGKKINKGSKARVSLTYFLPKKTEYFSIDIDNKYQMDCQLDKDGEGIILEQEEANESIEEISDTDPVGSENVDSEEITESNEPEEPEEDIIVFDQEGIRISIAGYEHDAYDNWIRFKVENLNHHDIIVYAMNSEVIVNGLTLDTAFYNTIKSGRKAIEKMYIFNEALAENDIDEIKDLSFVVGIMDASTYAKLFQTKEIFLTLKDDKLTERVVYTDKDSIRKVQELLNKAGYECGSADGVAGKMTNNAILEFKKANELDDSTDITIELIMALEKATE